MTDLVQVDLDKLHGLGGELAKRADDISAIEHTVTVWMSDGPMQKAFEQTRETVRSTYGFMGDEIRQMADAAKNGVKTYEDMEHLLVDQFRRYVDGR
ncbi:hypothetical protein DFR70_102217 [Nocardia tenerifensis]|uniref:Uncharacterized protein n=1 Tax=Nocardia tenerifensis TaxID=228006 RepID=A0A318K672_9NOCA|nr:hypothetical protein [Nocardia tenerifensis]PXX68535.1 hypothetical protein DFR70_102217 [Nocardia tenerifensis]